MISNIISTLSLVSLLYVCYLKYKDRIWLGFSFDRWALGEFGIGAATAFIPISLVAALLAGLEYIKIQQIAFDVVTFGKALTALSLSAFFEEFLFRTGILLALIYLTKRVWLAVGLEVFLFGIAHMFNPSATLLTMFSNGMGGLMYSLAFLVTGRIWMPVALHLLWNFSQALYGFNISGRSDFSDMFIMIEPVGNSLISGGAFGLEASLLGIIARFLIIAALIWLGRMLPSFNAKTPELKASILPKTLRE